MTARSRATASLRRAGYGTAVVDVDRNWARNVTYSAPVQHPASLEAVQEAVAGAE